MAGREEEGGYCGRRALRPRMRQVPRRRRPQAAGPRGSRCARRQSVRLAGRGRGLDRDRPPYFLRRLPQHAQPILGARDPRSPAVEGAPDDLRHAAAAWRVHLVQLRARHPGALQLWLGYFAQPENAHVRGEAADRPAAAAHVGGGAGLHRRAGRAVGARLYAQVRHARAHQRGGLHLDGQGARLHRPGQALHDRRAHRHEPIPE
mmetsp:Transcript_2951/g.9982  ORF Transcript_2951/g.9982 Transcript_2951/m.9982 type:complete len:205 (+) Transcript_2951:222-836(+)